MEPNLPRLIQVARLVLGLVRGGGYTDIRDKLGLTSEKMQSAHLAAQSMMREVFGWEAKDTITAGLPKDVHYAMDKGWKSEFSKMPLEKTKITIQEGFDALARSIRDTPNLTEGQKDSLILRMWDEIFLEYRLDPTSTVRRPYSR